VGLLLYGLKHSQERVRHQPVKSPMLNILDKVKKFFIRDD